MSAITYNIRKLALKPEAIRLALGYYNFLDAVKGTMKELNISYNDVTGAETYTASSPQGGGGGGSIADNSLTLVKLAQQSANTILGNSTGITGNVTTITLGSTLSFSSGVMQTAALSGDVTTAANSFSTTVGGLKGVNLPALTTGNLRYNGTSWIMDATTYLSANQSISLSSDVTGSGTTTITATIAANAVTYAKFQTMVANSLHGNPTGSTVTSQAITLGSTLAFSGTTLQTAALTGDVTANANSFATTIAANAVTFAKMQTIPTVSLMGNSTGGSAVPQSITLGSGLSFSGTTLVATGGASVGKIDAIRQNVPLGISYSY